MTREEHTRLELLDTVLRSENIREQIRPIVERVHAELVHKKEAVMTWESLPLAIFGRCIASRDPVCVGVCPACRCRHRHGTSPEQSSAHDVVRRQWQYANRRAGTVAIECFG